MRAEAATLMQRSPSSQAHWIAQLPTGTEAVGTCDTAPVPTDATVYVTGAEGFWAWYAVDQQRDLAPSAAPLRGTVALVTGAASGLGKAVALALHAAGACIAAADLNLIGLKALQDDLGAERWFPVHMNVTDEENVITAFDATIKQWGRLDTLACCAGIAPSAKLADFELSAWQASLAINLTGYFLCGREATRIMQAQGPEIGGAMVLLSSKSGLEPSKNNTAYNATKAGELHLARGWALELGPDNIRVNCIAPGNVFKGSKIWNDDYIKQCAIKKGIEPEEVIPHYVGLTALNREIDPQDIGNTAVYLASPMARRMTGQVLVVDAGQAFTR
jgi:NAD(P)-dependent dehydrogenase (short-subunit alcohol dehydrogenase family)